MTQPQSHATTITDYTTLIAPDAIETIPTAINNNGDVTGWYVDSSQTQHSFIWHDGQFTPFDVPGSSPNSTQAHGINDSDEVVGYYDDSQGVTHGFLKAGISYSPIDDPASTQLTEAYGINNSEEVVGNTQSTTTGFFESGGTFSPIGYPGSADTTQPYGINDDGEIAGLYYTGTGPSTVQHGFTEEDGDYTSIDDPDGILTDVFGLNNKNQLIGYVDFDATDGAPFVYENGTFDHLTLQGAADNWWIAYGINDKGQIVGYYEETPGSEIMGFVTPEPTSLSILAITLVFGLNRGRRNSDSRWTSIRAAG